MNKNVTPVCVRIKCDYLLKSVYLKLGHPGSQLEAREPKVDSETIFSSDLYPLKTCKKKQFSNTQFNRLK